jgi:hypothetical protein
MPLHVRCLCEKAAQGWIKIRKGLRQLSHVPAQSRSSLQKDNFVSPFGQIEKLSACASPITSALG